MFSHALVAYQAALMDFFSKTTDTFHTTIVALEKEPHYTFTILKELTQSDGLAHAHQSSEEKSKENANHLTGNHAVDSDQLLFFNVSESVNIHSKILFLLFNKPFLF